MKKKRLLSLLLSAIMLIGSMPALVLAEGDEDYEDDPEMMDENPGEEEDDVPYLGSISENSAFPVGQMEAEELVFFTFNPSTTGRYGFLCADGRDLSATFYDDNGVVAPMEEKKDFRYDIQYLSLEAGKTYQIEIEAGDYATLPEYDVYCYICPMSETLPYGESTLFVKSRDSYTKHTFIPQESGMHIFEFTPANSSHFFSNIEISSGSTSLTNVYGSRTITVDLKAGVPYDIKINYWRESAGTACCNVVKVNIKRDIPTLVLNENFVELKANSEESIFGFTPEVSGVYVFESKGDYDTQATLRDSGNDYGEGSNFRLGTYLEAGKTYYIRISQNSAESVTVPVYVKMADQIQPGQNYSFDVLYQDNYFYTMTPAQSGWYHFDSGNTSHSLTVRDSENNCPTKTIDSWYMEAGKTYYLTYQHYGFDTNSVSFSVYPIDSELTVNTTSSISSYSDYDGVNYTVFTPDTTGIYEFTSDRDTSYIYIYNNKESIVYESVDTDLKRSVYLTGGTPYLICFSPKSAYGTPYDVKVTKLENAVKAEEVYTVDFPSSVNKQYSFTPEESGYYWIYSFGGLRIKPVREEMNQLLSMNGSGESGFQSAVVELEAGKKYALEFYHNNSNLEGMNWCIHKVDSLAPGKDIDIDVIGGCAYYTFTPSENGVYTFTSDMFSAAESYSGLLIKIKTQYGENILNYALLSGSTLNNGVTAVLEKGKTYNLVVLMKNRVSGSYVMDIVKEQALQLGENTVSITDRHTIRSFQRNAFCSFTPAEDGLYSIMSKGENGVDPHITIYDSQMQKVGEDDSSGEVNWNFKVELFLNGGETYYIDIDETEEFDLPVEIKQLEIMEAKLEGYTLSLDGSIAVNLYMTLNESVAESSTAVLKFTRETASGNTVVSYGMDKAQKRVLNGKTYYVFHLPVAAKEMTSELKAQIVDPASAFEGKEYTFTVQEYAQYIINRAYSVVSGPGEDQEYMDALPLVYALLNYGTAAQNYFGFKVDKPANSINYTSSKYMGNVPTSALPVYSADYEVMPEGVTFEGSSLSIESETALTFYFKNTSGAKLTFTDDSGARLSAGKSGEYTTVKVKGIPAHKLSEYVTIRIKVEGDASDYKVSYNPMTYCYNVLTRPLTATRTAELKEMMKAFYFYNQAAERYMEKKAGN